MAAYDARRGLGVSLGAGALLRRAVEEPEAFDRLVFVLPATIDQPREDEPAVGLMQTRAELVEHRDLAGLAASLVAEQPTGVRDRPDVRAVGGAAGASGFRPPSVARALRELPPQYPLESRTQLAAVTCPVLVIGQQGDAAHPRLDRRGARRGCCRVPSSRSTTTAASLWSHRAQVRTRISTFLNTLAAVA